MNKKVIIITGPTASGKSGLAVSLAKEINGEIISADCIQVYKELNIGSAKVTEEEMQGIPHYLIDIKQPNEDFSVSEFITLTKEKIDFILAKGKLPIIVGGTGMYIKALVEGYNFTKTERDEEYRNYLKGLLNQFGSHYLHQMLKDLDCKRAEELHPNDTVRIIRALEIIKNGNKQIENEKLDYDFYVFALNLDRKKLYDKINARVDLMIQNGLIDEVRVLKEKYNLTPFNQSMKGIDYKETLSYLNNEINFETLQELIKQKTRNYAKRQITFIKGIKDVVWLDAEKNDNIQEIIKIASLKV